MSIRIPILETKRLRLRAPEPRDFEAFAAFCSGPRSATVGGPYSRGDAFDRYCMLAGHWQVRGFGRWIVADKFSDAPLGVVGLNHPERYDEPEIAWTVFDGAEGLGIAYEAAIASRSYAIEQLGWTRLVSMVSRTNRRSVALAERMGCIWEGDVEFDDSEPLGRYRHQLSP